MAEGDPEKASGRIPLRLAAAALLAGPAVLSFFSGGYGDKAQLLGLAAALCALGTLAVVAPWPLVSRGPALTAIAALYGLALWSGLSIHWSRIQNLAANEAAQLALYASVFAATAVAVRDPRVRRLLPGALLAGVAIVALYALAGRLLADLVPTGVSLRAGSRIQQPLTYWNALGLLVAFGILLGAAVASDPRPPRAVRAAACAAAVPCALVLYLTFSRGSLVALAAGFVALVLVASRRSTVLAGALVLGAAGALGLLLQALPAVLELEDGASTQTAQGAVLLLALLVVTAGVGAAFARLARSGSIDTPLGLSSRARRVIALATVAAVVGLGWLIVAASEKTDPLPTSKGRLTKLSTNRGEYWKVALDSFAAHPVIGVGAGSFGVEWRRDRESDDFAQDAHSLYLETLAELGLVGAVLLAALIAAAVRAVTVPARDPGDGLAPAAAACLAALLVHVGLDWTWEFPSVVLVALILVAAAATAGRRAPIHRRTGDGRRPPGIPA